MATLEGHLTKLQAVNELLWTIGETPVNSLSSGLPDAEQAESLLDRESRRVQLQGWHCNTLEDYELSKNTDDQFVLPVNTLKVDTVNPRGGYRRNSTPSYSAGIDAVMRRSADDTKWVMFDRDNNTEFWTDSDPSTLTVQLVLLLPFEELTVALQHYIWARAAMRFQTGAMGSKVLHEIGREDVLEAMTIAVQEDTANEDQNIIRDNAHVNSIARRNNPLYGR
jgi:hypothetical protein